MASVYDDMIKDYTTSKTTTQKEIKNLATEKQNLLNDYNNNYNQQLTNYDNLINQQQDYINTWADTQKETQQKQTDFEVGLINQNKQEAEKKTNAEIGNAYIDYQKGLNQFGGSAETLASQGLGGTGFAKNQDIAMNITYQNRVASAKSALQKANTDYDNQIQQALLNNDAKLAEIALQQMQQSYQLALQGFEYKNTMYQNKLNYIQNLNDSYFSKTNTLQNRIDNYTSNINSIKAAQAQEQAAATARYYSGGSGGSGRGGNNNKKKVENNAPFKDTPKTATLSTSKSATGLGASLLSNNSYYNQYTKKQTSLNKDAMTNGKLDSKKVFSNGYQPNNVNGAKLSKVNGGMTVAEVFGKGKVKGQAKQSLDSQNIWQANGNYYVWDGAANAYQKISTQMAQAYIIGSKTLAKPGVIGLIS